MITAGGPMQFFSWAAIVAVAGLAQLVKLNPQMGAVLPSDQALTFARPRLCNRPAPGPADGTWTPDAGTIRRLESVLAQELQAALDLSSERRRPLLAVDFYRQYAPLVVAGRRIVYVNGLHSVAVDRRPKLSWKTTASRDCDGGQLFFGTQYDVATGRLSTIIFNGGGRGASPAERAGSLPPDLSALISRASIGGRVYSWCPVADGFAAAMVGKGEARYVALHADGRTETLAVYTGGPDLTCYSRREAEKLDAAIRSSETIEGSLTPRWDSTVVCGFVEDTRAICWQFSPNNRAFVVVGGWTT
jgi:hypothetical protein